MVVVGAGLVLQLYLDALHGRTGSPRFAALAPAALLVGPWLLATGTLGRRTLPESPVWHRAIAVALAVVGFVLGVLVLPSLVSDWAA